MITVVMTTYAPEGDGYKRADYTKTCVQSLIDNLRCSEPLSLHVGDDGSYQTHYIKDVMIQASKAWKTPSSTTNSKRRGIGASLNLSMKAVREYWMYTTDDWKLTNKLYLAPALKLINMGYDLVRLGPVHPNLSCRTRFNEHIGWWLDIDHRDGFAFATRPFLTTKDFITKVGPFDEGLNAYEVERLYNERISKMRNILIAYDGAQSLEGSWEHIGDYEVGTINDFSNYSSRPRVPSY